MKGTTKFYIDGKLVLEDKIQMGFCFPGSVIEMVKYGNYFGMRILKITPVHALLTEVDCEWLPEKKESSMLQFAQKKRWFM
jgi:hypothetical protein